VTVVRTGTTKKYSHGWEKAFGKSATRGAGQKLAAAGKKSSPGAAAVKPAKQIKPGKKKSKRTVGK
jgi:hypothetical protein